MRVKKTDTICGVPAVALRNALRRLDRSDSWTLDWLGQLCGLSARRSHRLGRELAQQGYIKPATEAADGQFWELTIQGRALSHASAAKPISRATADRVIREVIARAEAINRDNELVFLVAEMVIFGSYLGDTERLSDVDVGFRLARRRPDADALSENNRRVAAARLRGRVFQSWFAELTWDRTEILLLLKSRSRAISLHDMDVDAIFRSDLKVQVIFGLHG